MNSKGAPDFSTAVEVADRPQKVKICDYHYKGYCSKYDDGCFHQCVQKQVMALYSEKSDKYSYLMDVLDSINKEPTVIEAEK